MQRVIKFRAWDKENKNWVFFELERGGWSISRRDIRSDKTQKSWEDWMQFTGLKDKNGKEVYEGDVIGYKFGNRVVVVEDGHTWIKEHPAANTKTSISKTKIATYRHVVIGNIYENPELLKV